MKESIVNENENKISSLCKSLEMIELSLNETKSTLSIYESEKNQLSSQIIEFKHLVHQVYF